ncbi:hypothetical protein J2J97_31780 (plasmid) [Rhizobium bangladeshense]|uniref:hypothetical protein n=1 Tax=Rhizobium bangladeshense TaxID=1138189 RepID=UPI001A98600C|nr:hypothetical protein [Rhizobium bangladeshense]QSY98652.1 hypothetical protein J2J97_31780 [Rhizobium bangladeshense]
MIADLPPDTVRDRILQHLVKRFRDCVAGENGRFITWNTVSDCPLTSEEITFGNALGIYDGRERNKDGIGLSTRFLEVQTEFKIKLAYGDKPAKVARAVLGEVQTVMTSDIYCTEGSVQLSLDIVEIGNELDVDGPHDQTVAGIVFWEIQYRHIAGKPRNRQGE